MRGCRVGGGGLGEGGNLISDLRYIITFLPRKFTSLTGLSIL